MYDYKIRRLVLCNSIVFLFFLFLVEIFLGKWRLLGTPVTKIPGAPFLGQSIGMLVKYMV